MKLLIDENASAATRPAAAAAAGTASASGTHGPELSFHGRPPVVLGKEHTRASILLGNAPNVVINVT